MRQLRVWSEKMKQDLIALGCVSKKSLVLKPDNLNLKHNLVSHFIRGYWDGDGWLSTFKDGPHEKSVGFEWGVAGTKEMLDWFLGYLTLIVSIKNKPKKEGNIYTLRIRKRAVIAKIMEYLYLDKDDLFLDRKYDRYSLLLKTLEEKRSWNESDLDLLKQIYKGATDEHLLSYFPNRSINGIRIKARRLGLAPRCSS